MKRIFTWGLMLAATLTLTNCAKEMPQGPVEETAGIPFEIVASTVDTKTANDGMSTKWVAEDQINLFHAVCDGTTYTDDGAFTVANIETGNFTGTISEELDPQEEYDWYAFYPYSSFIKTPANTSAGYMPVGCESNKSQTQNGNNSMAHIAGENYPLVGKAYAVPAAGTPAIQMSHVSSLLEVVVTNDTEEPLTVSEIIVNAPEALVGTFFIDFSGEITPESFVGSGTNYVSNAAKLVVNNGTAIAKGESAKFYLAVKPFTVGASEAMQVYVNGYEKELVMTNEVTFSAGKIKTLNFSYDAVEEVEIEAITVADFVAKEDSPTVYELSGVVTSIYQAYNSYYGNISFNLKDATGEVLIFRMGCEGIQDPNEISVGDEITVQGTKTTYNNSPQMAAGGVCISFKNACDAPVIECTDNVVTITAEEGATIYYTTDETDPTTASTVYGEAFEITETTTVKAIAVVEGKPQSAVASKSCVYASGEAELITITKTIAAIADANGWKDATKYTSLSLDNVITVTATGGTNTGKYYTSGKDWRIYQSENPSLTISASNGHAIKSIKVTYTTSKSGILTYNGSNLSSGTVVTLNAASAVFGVGNTGTATNGQVRVTAIEVVYQAN